MLNVGLRLLENTALDHGERTLPFQFQLPSDALPSHLGTYANVTWKLSANVDIPWGSDLTDEGYLRILAVHSENPSPITLDNPQATFRLKLELPSNIFEPGDLIQGKLTLLEPGNLRTARVQITQREDANARGAFNNAHRDQDRILASTFEIRREELPIGSATPFQLPLPQLITSDYRGVYSSVSYSIEVVLDIPHSEDIHLDAPILIGLKRRPTPQPQAQSTTEEPQVTITSELGAHPILSIERGTGGGLASGVADVVIEAGSSTITSEDRTVEDARAAIIRILGDGSSKDLISISTELQMTSEVFLDLNHVKKLCEDLVSQGKLRRTAEGEFFAKYALNRLGSQE